jgi:amino acid transporter
VLAVEIAVLVVFIGSALAGLALHGPARPWTSPFTGSRPFELSIVVGAISIAVLSYLGFDAIASFAEESTGDERTVGRAVLVCLAGSGLLFVIQTYLAAVVSPIAPEDLLAQPDRQGTAFYDIVGLAISPWLSTVVATTKAVGPAFAAMTGQAAAARLLYGMARDGRLPGVLARVDARRGVPRTALVTTAGLTLAVSAWAARRSDGLDLLVSIVDMGALGAFTLLHASVPGYFLVRRRGASRAAHRVVPFAGIIVTLWVIAEASGTAKLVGLGWVGAGLALAASGGRRSHATVMRRPS